MKIFVIDTEYLSWKSNDQDFRNFKLNLNNPPEIIQIYIKEIFSFSKRDILLFIKPRYCKKYPNRIVKLTSIKKSFLDKKGISFVDAYKIISKFIPKNSIIISNGNESKIINFNIKLNKIKKVKKIIFFFDFNDLLNFFYPWIFKNKIKFISIAKFKKIFNLKKTKNHNAKNDVMTLINFIKNKKIEKNFFYKKKLFHKFIL